VAYLLEVGVRDVLHDEDEFSFIGRQVGRKLHFTVILGQDLLWRVVNNCREIRPKIFRSSVTLRKDGRVIKYFKNWRRERDVFWKENPYSPQ